MDLPGYKFHPLKGDRDGEYAVTVMVMVMVMVLVLVMVMVMVMGNWRITFYFDGTGSVVTV